MSKREEGMAYFKEGYNCTQSVVLAFADEFGLDRELVKRMSAGFGGGMGRMREVCGAVSGMTMVAGLVNGMVKARDVQQKKENYELVQKLAHLFEERNGSIICRELLRLGTDSPAVSAANIKGTTPEPRTEQYYKKRPCMELIGDACEFLEQILVEYNIPVKSKAD